MERENIEKVKTSKKRGNDESSFPLAVVLKNEISVVVALKCWQRNLRSILVSNSTLFSALCETILNRIVDFGAGTSNSLLSLVFFSSVRFPDNSLSLMRQGGVRIGYLKPNTGPAEGIFD